MGPDTFGRIAGVYFIQGRVTGLIKIGFSRDVASRLEALRSASPDALDVLGVVDGGQALERALHARFREFTEHGEWFRPSPDLLLLARTGSANARHVRQRRPGTLNRAQLVRRRGYHASRALFDELAPVTVEVG